MYRLYSGTGIVSDNSGGTRTVAVTASIDDTLRRWPASNPVAVTPGQSLASDRYMYTVGSWSITVAGLGLFFGSRGNLYIEVLTTEDLADTMWTFESEAGGAYVWMGNVFFDDPTNQNWPKSANPDFAQLPRTLKCMCNNLGPSITALLGPGGVGQATGEFTIKRV
jgi:hypothetical protein